MKLTANHFSNYAEPHAMSHSTTAARTKTPGLPKTWHEVYSNNGELLYWRREHTGYEVHPDCGRFRVELEGRTLAERIETLTHAIVFSRDHMHDQLSKQLTDQARSEALGG